MTHLGSAKDYNNKDDALDVVAGSVGEIMKGYDGLTVFLLEISAGAGDIIGSTFEELEYILRSNSNSIGICLDSAHMFASGYDIKTDDGFKQTIDQVEATVGLDRIKLIHANDSMVGLGEKKDRHEHIGEGKIGQEGFVNLMSQFLKIDMVLETDHDRVKEDIKRLKKLREELT